MNNTFRKHKVSNFTTIDNDVFKNRDMSLKGKGLLALMLSLPDTWQFSERGLVAVSKDGRSSVRSGLKELEELGYLKRKTLRDDKGGFVGVQYNVYEMPKKRVEKPTSDKPKSDNPGSDFPTSGIEPNKVLNELRTKELRTKELNTLELKPCFDTFYEAYPKKRGKGQAIKTFEKKVKDQETLDLIMKDLKKRENFKNWTKDNGKWIPHPSTYLNDEGWLDEYETNEYTDIYDIPIL